jgi:DNA-binding transcriptional MerR regulator
MSRQDGSLRVGDVATAAGVNVQTLHYYERRGLLATPRRSPAGYREYRPEDVRTVRGIKRAQRLGFTLKEIAELMRTSRERRDSDRIRSLAEQKLADIDERMRDLRRMRASLKDLLEACSCGGELARCDVLAGLGDEQDRRQQPRGASSRRKPNGQ